MFTITTEIIYVEINSRKDLRFAIALKIMERSGQSSDRNPSY